MSRTASRRRIGFVATRLSGIDGVSLEMTAHNYAVAARHYSYAVRRRHLQALLTDVFGEPAR